MNTTMLFLILFAAICTAVAHHFMINRDARILAASGVLGVLIAIGGFYGGVAGAAADTEILSGHVTGKTRKHDTYEDPYDCNCKKVRECSGTGSKQSCSTSNKCDTCYETHYTVKWDVQSTVGDFRIADKDSTSRLIYVYPDPPRWMNVQTGDAAAKTHTYMNYVQAVQSSLFTKDAKAEQAKFATLIPAYPDKIYDLYKIDRFLSPGYSINDAASWNADIGNMLRTLGREKQVNAIVVIAKTDDPKYEFALSTAWEGANKNDVVLVLGVKTWPKIDFVRVISWSTSTMFNVELRDEVMKLGEINRIQIMTALESNIRKSFVRKQMKDFEYLSIEVSPPTWLIALTSIFIALSSAGAVLLSRRKYN